MLGSKVPACFSYLESLPTGTAERGSVCNDRQHHGGDSAPASQMYANVLGRIFPAAVQTGSGFT